MKKNQKLYLMLSHQHQQTKIQTKKLNLKKMKKLITAQMKLKKKSKSKRKMKKLSKIAIKVNPKKRMKIVSFLTFSVTTLKQKSMNKKDKSTKKLWPRLLMINSKRYKNQRLLKKWLRWRRVLVKQKNRDLAYW